MPGPRGQVDQYGFLPINIVPSSSRSASELHRTAHRHRSSASTGPASSGGAAGRPPWGREPGFEAGVTSSKSGPEAGDQRSARRRASRRSGPGLGRVEVGVHGEADGLTAPQRRCCRRACWRKKWAGPPHRQQGHPRAAPRSPPEVRRREPRGQGPNLPDGRTATPRRPRTTTAIAPSGRPAGRGARERCPGDDGQDTIRLRGHVGALVGEVHEVPPMREAFIAARPREVTATRARQPAEATVTPVGQNQVTPAGGLRRVLRLYGAG